MAATLRNENELATLRCSMGFEGRAPVMRLQPFIGRNALWRQTTIKLDRVSAALFRKPMPRFDVLMGQITSQADYPIGQVIDVLNAETHDDTPLWIQIGQDSMECVLVPWERIIKELTGRNTLRIPNFLRNPYVPTLRPNLAICVTSPQGSDAVSRLVGQQLASLSTAFQGLPLLMRVTVFAAQPHHAQLQGVTQMASASANLDVDIAPVPEGVNANTAGDDADRAQRHPWLQWIRSQYAGQVCDGVHFISPAYGHRDRGTLALPAALSGHDQESAASPATAEDLGKFYDALGCSNMGFTAFGPGAWKDGVRMLANTLSWTRPGAIYLSDRHNMEGYPDLLRAIWTHTGLAPRVGLATPAYVHPSVVQSPDFAGDEHGFITAHPEHLEALVFDEQTPNLHAPDPGWLGGMAAHTFPAGPNRDMAIGGGAVVGGPSSPPAPPEPKRARLEQQIEMERARISSTKLRTALEQAHDKGALKGLDFLAEVMGK